MQSDTIHVYPTSEAFPINTLFYEFLPIIGYRLHEETVSNGEDSEIIRILGHYSYAVCNSVPDDEKTEKVNESRTVTDPERKHIEKGASVWTNRTDLVSHNQYPSDCDAGELNLEASARPHTDFVRLAASNHVITFCQRDRLGCAYIDRNNEAQTLTQIALKSNIALKLVDDPNSSDPKKTLECSRLTQISMHEMGHAFGLGDHSNNLPSVMSSYVYTTCKPTEYDIVALITIHQSRTNAPP